MKNTSKKDDLLIFALSYLSGIITHFVALSNVIKNADCWQYSSTYQSGAWEVSIGRWLIPLMDMLRGRLNIPYITIGLSCFWISLAVVFFSDIFGLSVKYSLITGGLFVTAPWICSVISYSYCCDSYALGFFLSVLAVWCIVTLGKYSGGGICSGFYNAFLCTVSIFFGMYNSVNDICAHTELSQEDRYIYSIN